jgi:hypothetical protein
MTYKILMAGSSVAREQQPLSKALLAAVSFGSTLAGEQRDTISELSRIIGILPIDHIAIISRKPTSLSPAPSFRLNVYLRNRLDFQEPVQGRERRLLADAHEAAALAMDSAGADFNLLLDETKSRTPEQIREGLMRTYDNPFSGWEVVLSGQIQAIPWQEPHITPN